MIFLNKEPLEFMIIPASQPAIAPNNKEIKTGDVLALENGRIKYIEDDLAKACFKLIKNMVKKQSSYITLFYGTDVDPQIMPALEKQIKQKFKDLEVNFIFGNQPVYHFIIAVE